jgi:hypothetical protein
MWAAVASAGPGSAFLALCLAIVVAYYRGKIISPAEYKRGIEVERRIAGMHEQRAIVAEARADKADAALGKMLGQLPPALRALGQSSTGPS